MVAILMKPEDSDWSGLAPRSREFLAEEFEKRPDNEKNKKLTRSEALKKVNLWLKTQRALHEPDQMPGGNPTGVTDFGHESLNSSIGNQWKDRLLQKLDNGVHDRLKDIPHPLWNGIGMNVKFKIAPRPSRPSASTNP